MGKGKMRRCLASEPLPRYWRSVPGLDRCPLLFDVELHRHARLAAKVILFRKRSEMLSFWKKFFGTTLGKTCSGVCRPIVTHVVKPDGSELLEVDPRYYAVIGLCLERLTFEVIVHESIHAGFAYSNRKAGRFEWRIDEDDLNDEEVCYPSGRIASAIIRTLIADGYEISHS